MKGQYFSFDAIIAAVIFMMAIVMLLGYWHSVKSFLEYQSGAVSREALRVAASLFIPAFPEGADCGRMVNLGFATSWNDRRVNETVITCSAAQPDYWLKEKFSSPYNISMKFNYDGNDTWIGPEDPASEYEVAKMRRAATVVKETGETSLATIDIYLYR